MMVDLRPEFYPQNSMIKHQIKTIEEAADFYRELLDETGSVATGRVEVSDYQISFFVEVPKIFTIEILTAWGEKTKLGDTVVEARMDTDATKPGQHISTTYFHCNREDILAFAREAMQSK